MKIESRKRHTIMDGSVVMFATAFDESKGVLGPSYDARGPFEVSASRDAVIVHRADCRSSEHVDALIQAIRNAARQARMLAHDDRGCYREVPNGENGQ